MCSAPTNETLESLIKNLTIKVDEGFSGVHSRQDVTNGNVKKNSEFRIQQQNNNVWTKVILVSFLLPLGFLFIKIYKG